MLKESQLTESSAEELICEPLWGKRNTELSRATFQALVSIQLMSEDDFEAMYKELIKKGGWHIEALRKRVEALYPFNMTKREIVFIGLIAESIGSAIMIAHLCLYWWNNNDRPENITLEDLQEKIFPTRVPSDEDLKEVWYATKVQTNAGHEANLIDLGQYSKSMTI